MAVSTAAEDETLRNLFAVTKGQRAIQELTGAMTDCAGNVPSTALVSISRAAAVVLGMSVAFIGTQAMAQPSTNLPLPPGAWAEAQYQASRFDKAFHSGGMSGVFADISACYDDAMRSGERLSLRECLVYDDFADRFANMAHRQNANLLVPPYFVPAAAYQRLAHYSGPAGFNDAQIMSGYLQQGSNSIFAALSTLNHRSR